MVALMTLSLAVQYFLSISIEEGRGQFIQASSPKQLLKNVISGIFPSSTHRIYRLEIAIISHISISNPALWSVLYPVAPLPFSLVTSPPPLTLLSKYSMYKHRQCVAGRGWEVLSRVGDHILQVVFTLYLTKFRTYKIALMTLSLAVQYLLSISIEEGRDKSIQASSPKQLQCDQRHFPQFNIQSL